MDILECGLLIPLYCTGFADGWWLISNATKKIAV